MVKWSVDKSWNSAKILHIFHSSEILIFFTEIESAEFMTEVDIRPAGSPLGTDYVLFQMYGKRMLDMSSIADFI